MLLMDQDLTVLITRGAKEGYLTFDEVNAYLPDEDTHPEKLNRLILAVERHKIRLIDATEKKAILAASNRPEPNVAEMREAQRLIEDKRGKLAEQEVSSPIREKAEEMIDALSDRLTESYSKLEEAISNKVSLSKSAIVETEQEIRDVVKSLSKELKRAKA